MQKSWMLVIDGYDGVCKSAINILSGYISGVIEKVLQVKYVKDLTTKDSLNYNLIIVGKLKTNRILNSLSELGVLSVPNKAEGYAIFVGKMPNSQDCQT